MLEDKLKYAEVGMKSKVVFLLNFLWTSFIAFSFPVCFGWIFLDITGHSKVIAMI